jgi:hypothetical protein
VYLLTLQGERQLTDVSVRGVRAGGWAHCALYNVTGGSWTVVDCTAMFPDGAGSAVARSLLPKGAAQSADRPPTVQA